MTRFTRFVLFALAYLGLSAVWIYGVIDQGKTEGSDTRAWTLIAVVAVLHVVFGYLVREWPAVLLPIAVLPMAVAAGYPESEFSEPGPVWFAQLAFLPFEVGLIAAGIGLRAVVDRRRERIGGAVR